jgi:hypothetical protein
VTAGTPFIFVRLIIHTVMIVTFIHAHSLKIETGRYLNIDRQERICDFCNGSCLEDEFHSVII